MEDKQHPDETISTFCSITGAPAHVAEHYLAGFNYDLDRAVNFFFENPADAGGPQLPGGAGHAMEEDEDPPQTRQPAPPPQQHATALDLAAEEDEELQRVLADSMRDGGCGAVLACLYRYVFPSVCALKFSMLGT